jgi:hypothetical protein
MDNIKVNNPKKESFVPYVIVNANDQRGDEGVFDLLGLIINTPNDGDLGKIIRQKFLKTSK